MYESCSRTRRLPVAEAAAFGSAHAHKAYPMRSTHLFTTSDDNGIGIFSRLCYKQQNALDAFRRFERLGRSSGSKGYTPRRAAKLPRGDFAAAVTALRPCESPVHSRLSAWHPTPNAEFVAAAAAASTGKQLRNLCVTGMLFQAFTPTGPT